MREPAPWEKAIRRASDAFASYQVTGLNAKGKKAPAALSVAKSSKAAADAERRLREKADRTEAEHRAYLDHKNALRRVKLRSLSVEEDRQYRDRRNAARRAWGAKRRASTLKAAA
jgi:hypothetical protein